MLRVYVCMYVCCYKRYIKKFYISFHLSLFLSLPLLVAVRKAGRLQCRVSLVGREGIAQKFHHTLIKERRRSAKKTLCFDNNCFVFSPFAFNTRVCVASFVSLIVCLFRLCFLANVCFSPFYRQLPNI